MKLVLNSFEKIIHGATFYTKAAKINGVSGNFRNSKIDQFKKLSIIEKTRTLPNFYIRIFKTRHIFTTVSTHLKNRVKENIEK